ncbi:MAG: RecB family exonuclease [Acidimicrobiales bacterium]
MTDPAGLLPLPIPLAPPAGAPGGGPGPVFDAEGAAPRYLSPSSASTFSQCPRRWRFRYVERLPDPPGEAAVVGTLVHRVLELLCNEAPAQRTPERARLLAGAAWGELTPLAEFAGLGLDAAGVRAFKWRAWRAIEGLWKLEDPAAVAVAATEHKVEAVLAGVPFLGVVDRLDRTPEGLVVTDYKSGRPPHPNFAAPRLAQVLLYAAAVAAVTGEAPVRSRLVYLGATVISAAAEPDAVEGAVAGLAATWEALNRACAADQFPARPGPLCGWCPFAGECPEGRLEIRRRADAGRLPAGAPGLSLVA